jgi:hypothetical protein
MGWGGKQQAWKSVVPPVGLDAKFYSFLLPVGGVCFGTKILVWTGISWEGDRRGFPPWLIAIFGEHMDLLQSVLQKLQNTEREGITDHTNKSKDTLCSWITKINTGKMSWLPKAVYSFSAISVKIPMSFFHRNKILKKNVESQQIVKATLTKKNKLDASNYLI